MKSTPHFSHRSRTSRDVFVNEIAAGLKEENRFSGEFIPVLDTHLATFNQPERVIELLRENIIRGRALFVRSLLKAQSEAVVSRRKLRATLQHTCTTGATAGAYEARGRGSEGGRRAGERSERSGA